jgi:hypothetical protein
MIFLYGGFRGLDILFCFRGTKKGFIAVSKPLHPTDKKLCAFDHSERKYLMVSRWHVIFDSQAFLHFLTGPNAQHF